jgi:glycerol-1-phosphatase
VALGDCERALCEAYDAALYDLDGVLYLGPDPVPHAAEAVAAGRRAGLRSAFVTNNASRRPQAVAAHLEQLGIAAAPSDVVTSAQAAARLLSERLLAGAPVLVLGTDGLAEEVADAGLTPVRQADGPEGPAVAVVQGLAPETAWTDLAEAAVVILRGGLWVAGNTDSTYPSARGRLPGNGALVAALVTATGLEPVVVGKPEPALHRESVARVGAVRPLVVGDRLDTDVLGAVRGDADSLLVLTGVADRASLLAAPRGSRPTYIATDLRGLLVPHRAPEVRGEVSRCGRAEARVVDGEVVGRLIGPQAKGADMGAGPEPDHTDADDVLRAECALAWALADRSAAAG